MGVLDEIADAQVTAGVALGDDEAMELAVAELRAARVERARRASAQVLRVVVDPNVVVSAAISPGGVTGRLVRLGLAGQFRMVVCPMLLHEASEVLTRPKLRRFVSADAALELLDDIEGAAETHPDPAMIEALSRDPDDDYLRRARDRLRG